MIQSNDELLPKNINLTQEFSALIWAKEFSKIYPMILKDGEGAMKSEEVMLTWFANAIMAGHDHALNKPKEASNNALFQEIVELKKDKRDLESHLEGLQALVPLDESEITRMFEKYLEPHTCGWKIKQTYIDNGHHFKTFIKDICDKFGQQKDKSNA